MQVRFTPIRHPQANPSERCMREISKFCKIYCSQNYRKWAGLLPKIEEWLNTTVADSTGFTPVELLFQVSPSRRLEWQGGSAPFISSSILWATESRGEEFRWGCVNAKIPAHVHPAHTDNMLVRVYIYIYIYIL